MSDQTTTQLTAISALDEDDLMVVIEDGTAKKVTVAQLRAALTAGWSGWEEDSATWTYIGAHQFSVTGDRTAEFSKGTRIRYKQGGSYEYGVVRAVAFSSVTTVTLATNTDYALADQAITDGAYSYAINPQGYPGWFTYTPTYGGFSVNPPGGVVKFAVVGPKCHWQHNRGEGTSNATTFTITVPIPAVQGEYVPIYGVNNSAFLPDHAMIKTFTPDADTATLYTDGGNGAWTASGGKTARWNIWYEI